MIEFRDEMTSVDPRLLQVASFAGLTDDALAHLVLIGMISTADAQLARRLRSGIMTRWTP